MIEENPLGDCLLWQSTQSAYKRKNLRSDSRISISALFRLSMNVIMILIYVNDRLSITDGTYDFDGYV